MAAMALAAQSMAQMRDHRRVVIASAPSATDPKLAEQHAAIAGWRGAAERDVTLVTIAGDRVTGAIDNAAALRHGYALPADRFVAVLIGKDGHVARRATAPFTAAALERAIDAMPMRRAGLR